MKHKKEIIVAILAILALFLLYFGFNYLKGINIFNKTTYYVVKFEFRSLQQRRMTPWNSKAKLTLW